MATKIYKEKEIQLQDGTAVTLRPMPIGRLRRFMKVWEGFDNVNDNEPDGGLDIFVACSGIALEKELADQFDGKTKGDGDDVLSADYREYLEDVLDMDTIYEIMEICGGMKLNDPNLLAAVARANQEAGTN